MRGKKSEIESENIWVAGVSLLFPVFLNSKRFEICFLLNFVKVMQIIVEVYG